MLIWLVHCVWCYLLYCRLLYQWVLTWVSTKRRPKTEDQRPKNKDPNFFAQIRHGQLKNQAKAFLSANRCENNGGLRFVEKTPWIYKMKTLTKRLCQTPTDVKSMGSSFCRKTPWIYKTKILAKTLCQTLGKGEGNSYTLPIGVYAAQRGHDFGAKTLCQTPTDAKSRGSSFCRKKPLNLYNEDPC